VRKIVLFVAFSVALIYGAGVPAFAQTDTNATTPSGQSPAPATASGTTAIILPKLTFTWDCGGCVQNEKVPPLIEQAYLDEAKNSGLAVSDTDIAEVAIVDIRQRPPGVRVMFGVMSGRDRLAIRIRYKGKEYVANDYSANSLMGLNHLSESVGKKTYAALANSSN
jgi:hypothetical protein